MCSTNKKPPQFIEGNVFKTIIPVYNDADDKNEGINKGINNLIYLHPKQ
jgi:hypothetical protein